MVHQVITSDNEWHNQWQRMTTNANEWCNKWQRVRTSSTASDNEWCNEWKQMRVILGFSIKQLCNVKLQYIQQCIFENIKSNICRSSHWRCSIKKLLLAILQYSQETSAGLQLDWKETLTQVFSCEHCKIFKNAHFEEHLRTAASASVYNKNKRWLCGSKTLHKIDLKDWWIGQVLFK